MTKYSKWHTIIPWWRSYSFEIMLTYYMDGPQAKRRPAFSSLAFSLNSKRNPSSRFQPSAPQSDNDAVSSSSPPILTHIHTVFHNQYSHPKSEKQIHDIKQFKFCFVIFWVVYNFMSPYIFPISNDFQVQFNELIFGLDFNCPQFLNAILSFCSVWSPILPKIAEDTNSAFSAPQHTARWALGYKEEQPKSYITLGS